MEIMRIPLLVVALLVSLLTGCGRQAVNAPISTPTSAATATIAPEVTPSPIVTLSPAPTPTPASTPTPAPLPLEKALICIDPGHCVTPLAGKGYTELISPLSTEKKALYTTGTQGKGMTEEKLNLTVGLKLRDELQGLGATVIMTRDVSEITISGIERCQIANEAGADVAIRIHADGSTDPSVHGVSVLVPAGDLLGTPSIVDESVRLGQLMVDSVAKETGAKNRGMISRTDLTGFNFSEVPSVLIEMGFMTNAEEDARLETEEYQDKIVTGMVNSILAWYGVELR